MFSLFSVIPSQHSRICSCKRHRRFKATGFVVCTSTTQSLLHSSIFALISRLVEIHFHFNFVLTPVFVVTSSDDVHSTGIFYTNFGQCVMLDIPFPNEVFYKRINPQKLMYLNFLSSIKNVHKPVCHCPCL